MDSVVLTGDISPDLAQALRQGGRVAVDTETTGLDFRMDTLELCQLFNPLTGPVLVRRRESRPLHLIGLLEDPLITKVFHYAPFDLRFIEATWGVQTGPVFCTKAASKLLRPDAAPREHSLAAQLLLTLGITVDKGAVRVSDWSAPTLTPEQVAYAAADVTALLDLADSHAHHLRQAGLDGIHRAICAYMPVDAHLAVTGVPDPLAY